MAKTKKTIPQAMDKQAHTVELQRIQQDSFAQLLEFAKVTKEVSDSS